MEQNREVRKKNPCIYGQIIYKKGDKNIQYSIIGAGKTGQLHVKN